MKNVIILGAGGHAKVIADIIIKSGDNIVGFVDNTKSDSNFLGYSVFSENYAFEKFSDCYFLIAIGDSYVRQKYVNTLKIPPPNGFGTSKIKWYTAIHPSAIISSINVSIGEGSVIMANAVINSDSKIGKHCIINTSSVIEHDNLIDDYVHICPAAKTAGHVNIGKHTWLGIGSTVKNEISICPNCTIGAGAVVIKDITTSGVYAGIPARKIK